MSGSSFALEGTFQGVRLSRICSLAALLAESEGPDYAWVKRRFGERETNYEETMAFVVAVGLKDVRPARKRAGDGTTWARDGERALARTVVDRLVSTPTAFRDELRRYLRLFIVAGDSVVREFPAGVSEAEAAVRDFLIDLQLLRCDHHHRRYVLSERHLGLYELAWRAHAGTPPAQLRAALARRQALGDRVELAVVDFERNRLGPPRCDRVCHVAATDAAAGYDIASLTVGDGSDLPRLIEVKAVGLEMADFYWTANEIAAAHRFRGLYFLYLVPASDGYAHTDRLRMVRDPWEAVLNARSEWSVEPETVHCALRTSFRCEG